MRIAGFRDDAFHGGKQGQNTYTEISHTPATVGIENPVEFSGKYFLKMETLACAEVPGWQEVAVWKEFIAVEFPIRAANVFGWNDAWFQGRCIRKMHRDR